MNIASTTRYLVVLLAVCLISQPIFAQNIIWSEDFGGGAIPAGWGNSDPNDPTVVWEYETDSGRVTAGPPYNGVPFQSTTVSNGFVMFDSDGYGQNVIHDVRLETPAIDCSTEQTVVVRFQNQYAPFTTGSVAELGVSTDGMNWTYFPIFTSITPGNTTPQIANQTEEVDISSVAANQATVYIQFRWQGNWEYSWKIDDIIVQDAVTPLPSDNLALGQFFYVPDNFGTPNSQIASDTFDFFAVDVLNIGSSDQTNVVVTAEIIDASQNTLYMDTVHLGTVIAGDTIEADFNASTGSNFYIPNLMNGQYGLVYSVESDGTDVDPTDNVVGSTFEVNDSTYAKNGGLSTALRPGGGGDFMMGNVYTTGDAFVAGDFIAGTVDINVADNGTIDGKSVTVWLAEVSSNVDAGYNNFDATLDLNSNPDLTVVGFASYTFPVGSSNFDYHNVQLEDLASGGYGVALKPSTRYFLVVELTGASELFYSVGQQIEFFQISTIVYTTQWFLGGFGPEDAAAAHMNISTPPSISTNRIELEDATLAVFPNPADKMATVELEFVEATDATLFISDVAGRVLHMENLANVVQERLTLDVSNYAAGTYFVKVATTEGIKTQRLVVTH